MSSTCQAAPFGSSAGVLALGAWRSRRGFRSQDRQPGAVPLGSQELESGPLVLCGKRLASDGGAAAAEDARLPGY
jgi:hypothetical protein